MCVGGLKGKYQRDISCEKGCPLLGRKFLRRQWQIDRLSRRVLIKRTPSVSRRPSSEIEARKLNLRERPRIES